MNDTEQLLGRIQLGEDTTLELKRLVTEPERLSVRRPLYENPADVALRLTLFAAFSSDGP